MSRLLWALAELLTFGVDVAGYQWYLHRKLESGQVLWARIIIGGSLMLATLQLGYLFAIPDSIRMPILAAECVLYALFVIRGRGNAGQKIFHSLIAFFLVVVSDISAIALLTLQPGVSLLQTLQPTPYGLQAMIASKLVFVFLIFILSAKASKTSFKQPYWVFVISVPVVSMGILIVLLDSRWGNDNSYGLAGISFGIFVMNIVLLALHNRLVDKTRQLVDKEKILQQTELQNNYFNETLAAGDNMRGFRHDLRNHLQVLGGLLEMGKTNDARKYLNEIGTFIYNNDFMINCGYPLVDAVLGSKIAIARKLGIHVTHTISLDRGIAMEPMDLCSILGNLMDNAIEACRCIADTDTEKSIDISLVGAAGDVCLTIANTAGAPQPDQSSPHLADGQEHGIGLAIVGKTVQKYKGSMNIEQSEKEFKARIVFCFE